MSSPNFTRWINMNDERLDKRIEGIVTNGLGFEPSRIRGENAERTEFDLQQHLFEMQHADDKKPSLSVLKEWYLLTLVKDNLGQYALINADTPEKVQSAINSYVESEQNSTDLKEPKLTDDSYIIENMRTIKDTYEACIKPTDKDRLKDLKRD